MLFGPCHGAVCFRILILNSHKKKRSAQKTPGPIQQQKHASAISKKRPREGHRLVVCVNKALRSSRYLPFCKQTFDVKAKEIDVTKRKHN